MKKTLIFTTLLFIAALLAIHTPSNAEIYRYQDENGNWYYTDTPQSESQSLEKVEGMVDSDGALRDLNKKLSDHFKPQTAVEKASLGTVTVISSLGKGSGFFITEGGYIITNRHVIKGDDSDKQEAATYFDQADKRIEDTDAYLRQRERELMQFKKRLDNMKEIISNERDPSRKRQMEEQYTQEAARYRLYEAQFEKERRTFKSNKDKYMEGKRDYRMQTSLSELKRRFTIVLKDGSEDTATLVSVSKRFDLALLKLESCKTPVLKPALSTKQRQGQRVYAIGSPIGLSDSVCAGVISGFSDGYVKTDAKIYPGNSGGPLIDEGGNVIGINTLKMLTYQFEGLGFAIPIEVALREFENEIGAIKME